MKSKINISIPEPCHENWQVMTTVEKGKFCDSCQKNVFDFTKATDRQIIEAYNKDNKLCGRFLNTQLNRDLVVPKEKGSVWLATTSTLFSLLAFGNNEIKAQETPKTEQTETKYLLGEPAQQQKVKTNEEKEITGIVSDSLGPIKNVEVKVFLSEIKTTTDLYGKYIIKAKKGETLIFTPLGKNRSIIIVDDSDKINVLIDYKVKLLSGKVGMIVPVKRKTFFGRAFHKIGNWFK